MTPAPGVSRLPLSSTARDLIATEPARRRRPAVGPVRSAVGPTPGRATVDRDLDAAHDAATRIAGRAADRDALPSGTVAPAAGEVMDRGRRDRVGGGRGRHQAGLQASPAARPCRRTGSPSPAACARQPACRRDRAWRPGPRTTGSCRHRRPGHRWRACTASAHALAVPDP